eukprot:4684002-Heterocapsa_arctica.AAC.1
MRIFAAVHGTEGVVEVDLVPLVPFIFPFIAFSPVVVRNPFGVGAFSELALALPLALELVEVVVRKAGMR